MAIRRRAATDAGARTLSDTGAFLRVCQGAQCLDGCRVIVTVACAKAEVFRSLVNSDSIVTADGAAGAFRSEVVRLPAGNLVPRNSVRFVHALALIPDSCRIDRDGDEVFIVVYPTFDAALIMYFKRHGRDGFGWLGGFGWFRG